MHFMLLSFLPLLSVKSFSLQLSDEYWEDRRSALIAKESSLMLGGDITLSSDEEIVNDLLKNLTNHEFSKWFGSDDFPPSKSFLKSKPEIEQSDVFKFIKGMPKGSVLHVHDMATASAEWVVSNLTYWNDLYICNYTNDFAVFRFFRKPDYTCEWESVSEVRASYVNVSDFDGYLFSLFSLYTTNPDGKYSDINSVWKSFENKFGSLLGILSYKEAWVAYLEQAMFEFMNDNVAYIEFRGMLFQLYDKEGRIYSREETTKIYEETVDNFSSRNSKFFGARFIYSQRRGVEDAMVQEYVDLVIRLREKFPKFVAGFDLLGHEDKGRPLKDLFPILLNLGQQVPPVPVFFHAGETVWEGQSTDENLFDALLLNTSRVGHGYAISKHPYLLEMAAVMDVPVEICPISNQVLMLVQDLRNHPAAALAAIAFPMVISSDDPAIWGALPLSHDMYEAFVGIGGAKADLKFLKKLVLNSVKYSSLDDSRKSELHSLWLSQWDEFIVSKLPVKAADNHLYQDSATCGQRGSHAAHTGILCGP